MRKFGLLLLVLMLALAAGAGAEALATEGPAPMDSAIGAFSTVDLEGNPVDSNVFAGSKLTLVNVWATYCGPCKVEIPDLAKLDQEIDGFQVLGILVDAGAKGAADPGVVELGKAILSDSGAGYLNILPDDAINQVLMTTVYYVPDSFFVDEKGVKLGGDIVGAKGYDEWKELIEKKLAEIGAA